MQNYYIRIEDMPSLVSHQLSIIKYVVLKKIFFFLCFDRLIWTWTRTSLDSDLILFGLGLDSDLFGLGLVLDSTKVDLTTALHTTQRPVTEVGWPFVQFIPYTSWPGFVYFLKHPMKFEQ